MALHAVFAVVLAIVASSAAQLHPSPYYEESYAPAPSYELDTYDPDYHATDYKEGTYEPEYKPDSYAPDYKPDYYEPDHKPDYTPGVYPPDVYAPDQYVPEVPEGAVDISPPVDPYQPDGYGAVGYGYGNDLLEQLKQKVLLRLADQKAKIDSIVQYRYLTITKIEKISTLVTAWCRSKLFSFGHLTTAISRLYMCCLAVSVMMSITFATVRETVSRNCIEINYCYNCT